MEAGMARPMAESLATRRRRVLDAAGAALVQQGYHDVRLDDIARRAGLSKGALYLYFKDKEDLFAAVLSDVVDRLEERIHGVLKEKTALATLSRVAEALLEFVDSQQDFLIQFSREKPDLCGKKAGKILQDRYARVLAHVTGLLNGCFKEGALRAHENPLGSLFFVSLVRMFLLRKIVLQSRSPLKNDAVQLMDLFLHGLGK
jgi:AcrR family transcriptional regulator